MRKLMYNIIIRINKTLMQNIFCLNFIFIERTDNNEMLFQFKEF